MGTGLLDSIVLCVQSRHTEIQYCAAGILPPLSFDPTLQETLAKHNGYAINRLDLHAPTHIQGTTIDRGGGGGRLPRVGRLTHSCRSCSVCVCGGLGRFVEAALGLMRTASIELISLGTNTLWNLSACDATRIHLINKLGTPRALCVCVCVL